MSYRNLRRWRSLLIATTLAPTLAFAAAEPHLLFHMGLGANGEFFVGGTLENKGDEAVYKGFIVVTPQTEDCRPLQPHLWTFGEIAPGVKQEFRIPVTGRLYGYKLNVVHAVDSYGNALPLVDETEAILLKRRPEEIKTCDEVRQKMAKGENTR